MACTCSVHMSKGCAKMQIAHTCGGQMSKGRAQMWIAHTPAAGKCLRVVPKCRSHTPAVGKCLWHVFKHSPGWLHLLLRVVNHIFWPLVALKFLRNSQKAHFHLLRLLACPPGGQIQNQQNHSFAPEGPQPHILAPFSLTIPRK